MEQILNFLANGFAENIRECVEKNLFCEKIQPVRGSVLKTSLCFEPLKTLCHTGIYIGDNKIVELANESGAGVVRVVSPTEFLGDGLPRTGLFIYVACAKDERGYYALGDESVAVSAEKALGKRADYNLLFNNCHQFASSCISTKKRTLTIEDVENELKRKFGLGEFARLKQVSSAQKECLENDTELNGTTQENAVVWMSTGVSRGGKFEK